MKVRTLITCPDCGHQWNERRPDPETGEPDDACLSCEAAAKSAQAKADRIARNRDLCGDGEQIDAADAFRSLGLNVPWGGGR